MKLLFKLAFKNILGMGLRTWLNVLVLSFSFIIIIFYNGMIDGWNEQAKRDSIAWQYGQGQIWQAEYDPFDPFTLSDAHAHLPTEKGITPLLIQQGTMYPQGRMMPTLLKGIPLNQSALSLPTNELQPAFSSTAQADLPVMIGERMATQAKLQQGDRVLIRWRDKHGTFDAKQVVIQHIFSTSVPGVDMGQIWLPLKALQQMTGLEGEATIGVLHSQEAVQAEGWTYKSHKDLLSDLNFIIQSKKSSGAILYLLLLSIALLAIFDTQVLSVFRRQREIGTYIALGMTRWQVVGLFTIEGSANSILASLLGAVYGIPLLYWVSNKGIGLPEMTDQVGISVGERIYPTYSLGLIIGTLILVIGAATIVSFFPAKQIAKLNPIDALKGKLS